jgi:hypothetical protein
MAAMIEILTSWLNGLPAWALALVLCTFFLTITLVGIVLIHPLMRRAIHSERQAHDVVIFAAANYGLIYAVLLGLLTVATFQTTKDLEDHIGEEASSLSAMYHSAEDYPEPLRSELRARNLLSSGRGHLRNRQPESARERRSLLEGDDAGLGL